MSSFMNNEELQQLVLLYRSNIEQIRANHDNLLSMLVVVLNHAGGTVRIPYSEIEELGQGTPYTIRMVPDEQDENMVISVERMEEDEEPGPESAGEEGGSISQFPGGFDISTGKGRGPKFDA